MATARVLVVHDEPSILHSVSQILSGEGYLVFPAPGPRQALDIVRDHAPIHLVISDIEMEEMQGPELVSEVSRVSPQTAGVLIANRVVPPSILPADIPVLQPPLSTEDLLAEVRAALERSAQMGAELARGLRELGELRRERATIVSESRAAVLNSREIVQESRSARIQREGMDQALAGAAAPPVTPSTLTPREIEVLKLICDGRTSKQIALELGITFKTAVSHRSNIMDKLGIHDAVGLLRYAIRQKLIEP